MWRLIALASLLLALALGSAADAKCRICVESVTAQTADGAGGWGKQITLRLAARSDERGVFPESATAVVMQVDGDRSKCLTVVLRRIDGAGDLGTFAGTFNAYGQTTHSGRLDVGGDVYDFTVPLNGKPGTVQLVAFAPGTVPVAQAQATIAPATAPAAIPAAAQPVGVRQDDSAGRLSAPDTYGLLLGIGVVAFVAGTVLLERRRSARHRSETALEA